MFELGDPVETIKHPKGYGKITRIITGCLSGNKYQAAVKMAGRVNGMLFHFDELRPCKCKTRIPKGVSRFQT